MKKYKKLTQNTEKERIIMPKIPQMETIDKTAELTGLPKTLIRRKVLSGEIVAIKSGAKYLVNVDKLIEYLNTATIKEPEKADTSVIKPIPVNLY